MLQELVGHKIVVDLKSSYVCLGTLKRFDERYLELSNADVHDLRDTQTTREKYILESHQTGIKKNRKSVLVIRDDIVAVSRLEDVIAE